MRFKVFLFSFIASLFISSCGAGPAAGTEFSSTQAGDLIRRNLFLGLDQYHNDDPYAFQYGKLHEDGTSGGMLYRFNSDLDTLNWLIENLDLQKTLLDSANELPLEFLADRPEWWDPWKANPSAYYVLSEEYETGGTRRFNLVYDSSARLIYIVDHFEDMPGI